MHKKKIQALMVAGLLSVGVIGGTLAWFTSQDEVTNVFNTGSVTDPDGDGPDAGIEIQETFPDAEINADGNMEYKKPVLPGHTMTKEVSVTSTANYDQFLRAKITKVWKINGHEVTKYKEFDNGEIVYYGTDYSVKKKADGTFTEPDFAEVPDDAKTLSYAKIHLNTFSGTSGDSWTVSKGDASQSDSVIGYFYYNQILKGSATTGGPGTTSPLLESVTFVADTTVGDTNVDNYYKNLTFDVKVEAEGIQASSGAAKASGWHEVVPAANIDGYKAQTTQQ